MSELGKSNFRNKFEMNSEIRIMAFCYSFSGTLISASQLNLEELQICKETQVDTFNHLMFGTNIRKHCSLTSLELIRAAAIERNQLFFDLYLLSDDGKQIFPIPVIFKNLKKNDEKINTLEDKVKWQLTRRFLIDSFSGTELEATGLKVLRFAKSIELQIKLRDKEKGSEKGLVYPPSLVITYEEVTEEEMKQNVSFVVTFSVVYLATQEKVERNFSIILAVFCSCAVLWSFFRTWVWSKRAGRQAIDSQVIGHFVVTACGFLSNAFFLLCSGTSMIWCVVYKKQEDIYLVLPTSEQEEFLYIYLPVALGLKGVQIVRELCTCASLDIFFVDCEKYREEKVSGDNPESIMSEDVEGVDIASPAVRNRKSDNATDEEKMTNGKSKHVTFGKLSEKILMAGLPDVSIWRTYFVANEWIELCTKRRVNLSLHCLIVILMMNVSIHDFVFLQNSDYDCLV
ncbi:Meckelin [Halotydeus destructor]|nr:Meckelin [Halotydeus destructor]